MEVRLMGLPDEVRRVAAQLSEFLDVIDVPDPRPCRGRSRMVRVYVEVRLP